MDKLTRENQKFRKQQNRMLQHLAEVTGLSFWDLNRLCRERGFTPEQAVAYLQQHGGKLPKATRKTPGKPRSEASKKRKEMNKFLTILANETGVDFRELHALVLAGVTPGAAVAKLMIK